MKAHIRFNHNRPISTAVGLNPSDRYRSLGMITVLIWKRACINLLLFSLPENETHSPSTDFGILSNIVHYIFGTVEHCRPRPFKIFERIKIIYNMVFRVKRLDGSNAKHDIVYLGKPWYKYYFSIWNTFINSQNVHDIV